MQQFMTLIFQEDGVARPLLPDLWHELAVGMAALPQYASSSLRAIDVSFGLTPSGTADLKCAATGFWIEVARDGRVVTDHDGAICVEGPSWIPSQCDIERCQLAAKQFFTHAVSPLVGTPLVGSSDAFSVMSIDGYPNIPEVPSVGLFWIVHELNSNWLFVVNETCALAEAEPKGDLLSCPLSHDQVWNRLRVRSLQEIVDAGLPLTVVYDDYAEPPKGRVVYHSQRHCFTISVERERNNATFKKAVLTAFGLFGQKYYFELKDPTIQEEK
ncbi:hypothetical protein [Bradyrhizobium sp. CCGUVB14]|uniref:hypothetical protein n=1 Tax=Bradyrhizobium sp. CCGUVB14 TaxID=2949628 RepID=UPI0020B1E0F3|nr:hypothetical protein [Bradyrhizobium sp. CCGUVB14]MCP3441983.1 hypothetical protein [Bradyrhizobium sp. CCGUVB14]